MKTFRSKLRTALALTLLPPALVAGLYLYASTTGCSGGDCTGPMLGLALLALAAAAVTLVGATCLAGLLLEALWAAAKASLRRPEA
jgi:hypothetical protein